MLKLSVSSGNRKMGEIKSVSLPPIITCRKNAPCAKLCYACKMCRIYKNVKQAYENNLVLLQSDFESYFSQLHQAMYFERFFRMHVSGDIPNYAYFKALVNIVKDIPTCNVLMFTKQFEIVNQYLDEGNTLPQNLKLIFSGWGEMPVPNPYKLPQTAVIFKGTLPKDEWKICGGNCTHCACRGVGCWELKSGETIAFYQH